MDLSQSYQNVADSVVQVVAVQGTNALGWGTGSVIDQGNLVLTCAHCVIPGADMAIMDPANPGHALRGTVFFYDAGRDIAILEFSQLVGKPVRFANSSSCHVGNVAFLVGHPVGIPQQVLLSAHIASIDTD